MAANLSLNFFQPNLLDSGQQQQHLTTRNLPTTLSTEYARIFSSSPSPKFASSRVSVIASVIRTTTESVSELLSEISSPTSASSSVDSVYKNDPLFLRSIESSHQGAEGALLSPVTTSTASTSSSLGSELGYDSSVFDQLPAGYDPADVRWISSYDELPACNESWQIFLYVLYSLTVIIAVLGNVIAICVLVYGKRSSKELRLFLVNLSLADLTMATFSIPFTFTSFTLGRWIFGIEFCRVVQGLQITSVFVSVYTMMAIGVDRYIAIIHPLLSNRLSRTFGKLTITIIWSFGLGFGFWQWSNSQAVPMILANRSIEYDCKETRSELSGAIFTCLIFAVTFALPLGAVSFAYGSVALNLVRHSVPGNANEARDRQQQIAKIKIIKMLATIVILFAICWLPTHILQLWLVFAREQVLSFYATPIGYNVYITLCIAFHWLSMANSFVNPIIYCFMSENFRSDLRFLWHKGLARLHCNRYRDPMIFGGNGTGYGGGGTGNGGCGFGGTAGGGHCGSRTVGLTSGLGHGKTTLSSRSIELNGSHSAHQKLLSVRQMQNATIRENSTHSSSMVTANNNHFKSSSLCPVSCLEVSRSAVHQSSRPPSTAISSSTLYQSSPLLTTQTITTTKSNILPQESDSLIQEEEKPILIFAPMINENCSLSSLHSQSSFLSSPHKNSTTIAVKAPINLSADKNSTSTTDLLGRQFEITHDELKQSPDSSTSSVHLALPLTSSRRTVRVSIL